MWLCVSRAPAPNPSALVGLCFFFCFLFLFFLRLSGCPSLFGLRLTPYSN